MKRLMGIDLLRGIAAFGIVGCHLSLSPLTEMSNLVVSLCDLNVGIFAAVSGFFMFNATQKYSWVDYAKSRAKRLLPVYVFWSCFYLLATMSFDVLLDGGRINSGYFTILFWLRVLLIGSASTHLWFLIVLLYAQMVVYAPLKLVRGRYCGVIIVVLGAILTWMSAHNSGWFFMYPLRLAAFLLTGFGLAHLKDTIVVGDCIAVRRALWIGVCIFLVMHVLLGKTLANYIKDWLVVCPLMLAMSMYHTKVPKVAAIAGLFGVTSMGVYLVHPLVCRALSLVIRKFASTPYAIGVVVSDLFIAWLISLFIVLLSKKIWLIQKFI